MSRERYQDIALFDRVTAPPDYFGVVLAHCPSYGCGRKASSIYVLTRADPTTSICPNRKSTVPTIILGPDCGAGDIARYKVNAESVTTESRQGGHVMVESAVTWN